MAQMGCWIFGSGQNSMGIQAKANELCALGRREGNPARASLGKEKADAVGTGGLPGESYGKIGWRVKEMILGSRVGWRSEPWR